jgi:hypothetical protein
MPLRLTRGIEGFFYLPVLWLYGDLNIPFFLDAEPKVQAFKYQANKLLIRRGRDFPAPINHPVLSSRHLSQSQ